MNRQDTRRYNFARRRIALIDQRLAQQIDDAARARAEAEKAELQAEMAEIESRQ